MKKIFCIAIILAGLLIAGLDSCKKEKKVPEPVYILQKWAKSIEEFNYRVYSQCEAYPKDVAVFRDMYKDYFLVDLMAIEVKDEDKEDVRKDYNNIPYLFRAVNFEGAAVKRDTRKQYQVVRGDAEFIKFLEGPRKNDGWLMSNRTITRINR